MVFNKGSMTSSSCPQCHQVDRVQKVSAIVAAGTATGAYTGSTSGYVYGKQGGYVSTNTSLFGISQTTVSQQLSSPAPPTYKNPWGCSTVAAVIVLFLVGFGSFVGGIAYIVPGLYSSPIGPVIPAVTLFVLSAPFLVPIPFIIRSVQKETSRRRAQHANDMLRWRTARDRWERLYYCERDDGVFDPVEKSGLIPRAQMLGFLFR